MFIEKDTFKIIPFNSILKKKNLDDLMGGIYIIKCKLSHKIYIGSSKLFHKRFIEHRGFLRNNTHYNTHLQNSYNKYGESNFEFIIIKSIIFNITDDKEKRSILILKEQEKLDCLLKASSDLKYFKKNSFNLKPNADGGGIGLKRRSGFKKVFVFDINKNFIEEIESAIKASIKYNKAEVSKCCRGELSISKGFMFSYSQDSNTLRVKKNQKGKNKGIQLPAKEIHQYNLEGDFIKSWRCVGDASKTLNIDEGAIRLNIKKSKRQKRVSIWQFSFNKKDKIEPVMLKDWEKRKYAA